MEKALLYLKEIIQFRLENELRNSKSKTPQNKLDEFEGTPLTKFIQDNRLRQNEIITLLIALVPHISPEFFNNIISEYLPNGGDFPEFGGTKGKNHRGILPTGETVLYILAGKDVEKRIEVSKIFDDDHLFAKKNVLYLEHPGGGEPRMSGKLVMDEEYVDLFTTGKISKPRLSAQFPAELISTELEWKDLVLRKQTMDEIAELETWLKYNDT
ncbi:MAG: hypothetical protein ACOC1D_05615, partial [Prolixibacteraceae bacterium]